MIYLYSGDWERIPYDTRRHLEVKGWHTETGEEILQYGKNLLTRNVSVFTNNELVFLGIRVAIREQSNRGIKNAHLEVITTYFCKDYPDGANVYIDRDGNIAGQHYRGFFDTATDALIQLF